MIINQQPTSIHTAFNPTIVKVTKEGSETEAIIKIAFGNHDVLPLNFITKSQEYFNNVAVFDLSPVLKKRFSDVQSMENDVITDNGLFLQYSVFNNAGALLFKATALNAVSQIGVSSDFTTKRGFFLTDFNKLKVYDGYERVVSCLAFDAGTTYILLKRNGEIFAQTTDIHFSINVTESIDISNSEYDNYLRTNSGELLTTNKGKPITLNDDTSIQRSLIVEKECVPVNPFYIRWINQKGGRDYWMFSRQQLINRQVENQQTFNPVVTDQETANSFTGVIGLDAAEKVQVGAIQLTANEYECLTKLIYSPQIEWWNESIQKWISIRVDKGENENDLSAIMKSAEFTFFMQTPQLQF